MRTLTHKEVGKNVSNENRSAGAAPLAFTGAAVLAAGIIAMSQSGCSTMKNPVTVNNDTTVVISDTIVCPRGMGFGHIKPWEAINGNANTGGYFVFANVPVRFNGAEKTGAATTVSMDVAKDNGHLLKRVIFPTTSTPLVDLGLEKISIYVDSVDFDTTGAAKSIRFSVINHADTPEVYPPTSFIPWGDTSRIYSDTLKVGSTVSLGQFTLKLNSIQLATPTKLSVNFSVMKYNGAVARQVVVPELVATSIDLGMSKIIVTAEDIHLVISDTTRTPAVADVRKSWAIMSLTKDFSY